MWFVTEKKEAQKTVDKAPKQVQEKYQIWKNIVEEYGPAGLQKFAGFKDHALSGKWDGARLSSLGSKCG